MKDNVTLSILNTTQEDLPAIYGLFEASIAYQEKKNFPSWRNYDRIAVARDIENRNQYKVEVGSTIAIVFSICREDPVIWRHHENGDAVYLHRIVVNPQFKGQKMFGRIADWALQYCSQHGLKFVRMDTWANNPNLIQYYSGFGFRFVETYTTPDTEDLPFHNRNLSLALLELKV